VNRIINNWIQWRIIRPNISEYASPIVLEKKGEPRLCVDYRQLNKRMMRDCFPLPIVEDQLDCLQRKCIAFWISKMDFSNRRRQHQIFVFHSSKWPIWIFGTFRIMQFARHFLTYQSSIPRTYGEGHGNDLFEWSHHSGQRRDRISREIKTSSTHDQFGLQINWEKSSLFVQIKYLGHMVENGTVNYQIKKIQAITQFPESTITKAIQTFLGLARYFRKFIPHYALIARPLS